MTQDKIPHQRHIALKKSRHLSLKVTGHGAGGCAEIQSRNNLFPLLHSSPSPEFLDCPFACRVLANAAKSDHGSLNHARAEGSTMPLNHSTRIGSGL